MNSGALTLGAGVGWGGGHLRAGPGWERPALPTSRFTKGGPRESIHLETAARAGPAIGRSGKNCLSDRKNCDYCASQTDSESKNHLIRYPINSVWLIVKALIDILELEEEKS